MAKLSVEFAQFLKEYGSKGEKISSEQPAFRLGVYEIPKSIKSLCSASGVSDFLGFEGSVGKGSWSRTPWVAVFDTRATERASDGFYVAMISAESLGSVFLVLTNTSSTHINFRPFTLGLSSVGALDGFSLGPIPAGQLSQTGRGSGPGFERATLLWKKFEAPSLDGLDESLLSLLRHYRSLVDANLSLLPKDKPFKPNPFLLK